MLVNYETLVRISPFFLWRIYNSFNSSSFTKPINGATSWFNIGSFSFQPAEFAKVFVVLFLAMIITRIQTRGKQEINRPLKLLIILAALALPYY